VSPVTYVIDTAGLAIGPTQSDASPGLTSSQNSIDLCVNVQVLKDVKGSSQIIWVVTVPTKITAL
jgi:hypothetical protein